MTTIIDAEDKVLGRLATNIARTVKDGEEVKVVNSEKVVISGNAEEVKDHYRQKYERGSRDFGPYYPKRPDKILKRVVRNMLPDDSEESMVRTYLSVPHELDTDEVKVPDVKEGEDLKMRNYVKLGEVSEYIGWTPKGDY